MLKSPSFSSKPWYALEITIYWNIVYIECKSDTEGEERGKD